MTPPKAKTTISIDRDVLARVKIAVASGQAPSVSAYIEHAIIGQLAAEADFDAIIAELLDTTGGAPNQAEQAAAQSLLSDAAKEPSRQARRPKDAASCFGEERAEIEPFVTETGAPTRARPR